MLLFKRLATAGVLFVALAVIWSFGALVIGGAIVGAQAGASNAKAKDYDAGYEAGHRAGREFGRRYGPIMFLGACGTSLVTSIAISFSGMLPWCRRRA
jgi:uncharacterized membrane protein YfcA